MKTVSRTITVIILTICTYYALGQDTLKTVKSREYFLTLANISPINVSIKYKHQLRKRTFFKIGLVDISANISNTYASTSTSFANNRISSSVGFECGLEFRKTMTDKFTFFHGPNTSFAYQTQISITQNPALPQSQRKTISQTYAVGIPYTLGLLFHLSNHVLFSAEINPGLFINFWIYDDGQNPKNNYKFSSASFIFTNKIGLLSIAYRI